MHDYFAFIVNKHFRVWYLPFGDLLLLEHVNFFAYAASSCPAPKLEMVLTPRWQLFCLCRVIQHSKPYIIVQLSKFFIPRFFAKKHELKLLYAEHLHFA